MANKRMFTKRITDSDAFLNMPLSSQALYFHLSMHADDDGFVGSPSRIAMMIGANKDDLNILKARRFVLEFSPGGIIVIKHWRMHNTISRNRYYPTQYTEEKSMLYLKENDAYTFDETQGIPLDDRKYIEKNQREQGKLQYNALLPGEIPNDPLDGSMNPPEEDEEQPAADTEAAEPAAGPKKKKAPTKKEKEKEEAITEVLSYLKDKTGHDIRPTTKSHRKYVGARLTDGYTPEELKLIIDYKCMKWTGLFLKDGTNMKKFLTPKTLFSDEHCNDYLIEAKEFYDTASTPNTPTPAPAAAPETPAVAPLPQPELDDDFIPDF